MMRQLIYVDIHSHTHTHFDWTYAFSRSEQKNHTQTHLFYWLNWPTFIQIVNSRINRYDTTMCSNHKILLKWILFSNKMKKKYYHTNLMEWDKYMREVRISTYKWYMPYFILEKFNSSNSNFFVVFVSPSISLCLSYNSIPFVKKKKANFH